MSPDRYADFADLTSFVADIDLLTTYPDRYVIMIEVKDVAAGTVLSVETLTGETRTVTVAAGDQLAVGVRKILLATTVTRLRIFMEKS